MLRPISPASPIVAFVRPLPKLVAGAAFAALVAAPAAACGEPVLIRQPADATAYEGCNAFDEHGGFVPGQACRTPGTACQAGPMFALCTRDCRTAADCPARPGLQPV